MNFVNKRSIFFVLLSAVSSMAFVPLMPQSSVRLPSPSSSIHPDVPATYFKEKPTAFHNKLSLNRAVRDHKSSLQLASSGPDAQLVVGFVTIAAACTPYVLAVFFPDFFNRSFFVPVYDDDAAGRIAEIGWKVRYTTLALVLTTFIFLEAYVDGGKDVMSVLKDSYIVWALFYTEATRKIRSEATSEPPVFTGNRVGVQLWHILVVIVLWADVSESYTGNLIETTLTNLFT